MAATVYPDWRAKARFGPEGPQTQALWENADLKAIVAGLEAGQEIPPHPAALGMYHFLEGTGLMTVDGEQIPVAAGATVFAPEGTVRGIRAETRLAFLAARVTCTGG